MGQEQSTVRAIVRGLDGGQAIVEVEQGGCGRCHEEGGCGGQNLGRMFCSAPKTYCVGNDFGAKVGEHVRVAVATGSLRRTANLAYGLPLVATIACAMLGMRLADDAGAILGALLGLGLSFFYVRQRAKTGLDEPGVHPHIVSRS